jgi:hypothetical protein
MTEISAMIIVSEYIQGKVIIKSYLVVKGYSYKQLNTVADKRTSIEAFIFHTAPESFKRYIIG